MVAKIMITNGGPHPADKWAEVTADSVLDLIQIDNDSTTPQAAAARQAKRDLRTTLFNIFNTYHGGVQRSEQTALAASAKTPKAASAAVTATVDPTQHLSVMTQVSQAFENTPFAAHFAQPTVLQVITQIIGQHTADVMHIERKWHRDRVHAQAKGA